MTVLVLHSLPPAAAPAGRVVDEVDLSSAVGGILEALPDAVPLGLHGDVAEVAVALREHPRAVVFNACEAPLGRPDLEPHVAALLEWLGLPFTGNGSETLALCRRKDRTKAVLRAAGVPVAREGGFPCLVKPADEDGSAGIDDRSVCETADELRRARERLRGPAIIEEFLPGREFAVSLWGACGPEFASVGETEFRGGLRLNTYASKWDVESDDFANSPLSYETRVDEPVRDAVIEAARGAWRAVAGRGYMRVDVRLDAAGTARVIDVNPNPELAPGVGIHRAVTVAGWSWETFVRRQIEWAIAAPSPWGDRRCAGAHRAGSRSAFTGAVT